MRATDEELGGASGMRSQCRELNIPYYFSSLACQRQEDLQVGDYVRIRGLDKRYELMDTFPRFGSVRVREVGAVDCLIFPWEFVKPWCKKSMVRSKTLTQALGDGLYYGSLVCKVDAPDQVLRVRSINWDKESSWVEDEDGKVFELDWDDTEFWEI